MNMGTGLHWQVFAWQSHRALIEDLDFRFDGVAHVTFAFRVVDQEHDMPHELVFRIEKGTINEGTQVAEHWSRFLSGMAG